MVHTFNLSTQEGKASRSLWMPGLYSKFQTSYGKAVKPCLKKKFELDHFIFFLNLDKF